MTIWNLMRSAFWRWWEDNPFRLGAALAYYAIFSLAPVVLIAVTIAGSIYGQDIARRQIVAEIYATAGHQVGGAIEASLNQAPQEKAGGWTRLLSWALLGLAATAAFAQLQDSLNTIWGVKADTSRGFLGTIQDRFWSFLVVVGIGVLLLASLVLSTMLSALNQSALSAHIPGEVFLWRALDWLVSFALLICLFALIYKILPDVELEWRDVWVGAVFTAFLFLVGRYLIGFYLARSNWVSAGQAAGSILVILVWIYYSAQIFLFGAEFTYVYAMQTGKPVHTKPNAKPVTEEARAREGLAQHREENRLSVDQQA